MEREPGESVVGQVAEQDAEVAEDLGERGQGAAGRSGRDRDGVARSDAGRELAGHQHGVVGSEAREQRAGEEEDGGMKTTV